MEIENWANKKKIISASDDRRKEKSQSRTFTKTNDTDMLVLDHSMVEGNLLIHLNN